MKFTTKSCWLSSSLQTLADISSKVVSILSPSYVTTRIGVLHDDQEVNSSSGSLVFGIVRVLTSRSLIDLANLMVVDLQSLVADMDLHLLLIAKYWKSFLRILEDGKSTAAYVTTDKRVDVMKHYHTSLAHLKYGSIIDLLLRRFWWPSMKKDLKDFIARCPECQLDRSSSGIHAPLPIRPVPPVALPFERWGIRFLWSHGRDQVREQVFDYLYRLCNSMGLGQASQGHDRVCRFLLSFTN
ncbi:hypothetical protein BASA83_006323 [Batrachochytrium salamandrivorans]|nr:hypothetical protein BASA83_006323 [Batrachochytrium salamandrivorans]